MRIAPLADVKARLSAYVDECGAEGPIVITRNGKAVAVLLVPYDDDDLERLLLDALRAFQAMLTAPGRASRKGKAYPRRISGRLCGNGARTKGRGRGRPRHQTLRAEPGDAHLGDRSRGKMSGVESRRWTHGLCPRSSARP